MMFKSAKLFGWFQPKTPERYKGPIPQSTASIIIPFGSVDYLKQLSICLKSVRWQEFIDYSALEVLLVYLHKEPEDHREQEQSTLSQLVTQCNANLIDAQRPYDHFPLCLARNIGARAAKNDVLFFIDADAVLDPEFMVRALRRFDDKGSFVTCWFSYLKKNDAPGIFESSTVRELAPVGQVRKGAYGGGIVARKDIVHEIRGFDEVYDRAWGADDNDLVDRLIEYGLEWYNLSIKENIVNLHQYHPLVDHEKDPGTIANRERYYTLETIIRNDDGWGSASPSASPSTDPGFEV
jgi:hypothetical protein